MSDPGTEAGLGYLNREQPLPTPYYQDEQAGITLYCGDAREILPLLGPVDLVLTDPPYAISKKGSIFHFSDGSILNQDFFAVDHNHKEIRACITETARITLSLMKEKSKAYWWCGHSSFGDLERIYSDAGYKTGFIVWRKTNAPPSVRKCNWRTISELCLTVGSIETFLGQDLMANVFDVPAVTNGHREKNGHPTRKPLIIMRRIIEAASNFEDIILDPFCGSGTTLVAAKQLCRRAIGIEISEAYCRIVVERLRQSILPFPTHHPVTPPRQAALFEEET